MLQFLMFQCLLGNGSRLLPQKNPAAFEGVFVTSVLNHFQLKIVVDVNVHVGIFESCTEIFCI